MSHDSGDGLKGTIERRTFLQLAGGAALAGATQWASTAAAAPSKPYVPGSTTHEYDKMFVASVTPYKPGTEDIDEVAFRNYMRYWAQPKFINAGGAMLASPEAGEAFYLTQNETSEARARTRCNATTPSGGSILGMAVARARQEVI